MGQYLDALKQQIDLLIEANNLTSVTSEMTLEQKYETLTGIVDVTNFEKIDSDEEYAKYFLYKMPSVIITTPSVSSTTTPSTTTASTTTLDATTTTTTTTPDPTTTPEPTTTTTTPEPTTTTTTPDPTTTPDVSTSPSVTEEPVTSPGLDEESVHLSTMKIISK